MAILRYYVSDESVEEGTRLKTLQQLRQVVPGIVDLRSEKCYHVEVNAPLADGSREEAILRWLLKPTQGVDTLQRESSLAVAAAESSVLIEIGPRFNFSTPFSTNCVNICKNVGLQQVVRLETSTRYVIGLDKAVGVVDEEQLVELLSDRMTECRYTASNLPVNSFNERLPQLDDAVKTWHHVPIMAEGRSALEKVNTTLGLAFNDWDLDYYTQLFKDVLQRDPTTVELFDCAQSNSEHSRHWFFRGNMIVDGVEQPKSLIRMIMDTQEHTSQNNTIKFSDNSSAIRGFEHDTLRAESAEGPGRVKCERILSDLIFTAETHNMPTAVAPFSGATTGTGGRLRDVQGVGRGGLPIAGTAGYCVGSLNIPGYEQPYEKADWPYPSSFARPLKVLIEASNGASDYGNKFGEPVIAGFVSSYGVRSAAGERDEYVKPIMFSGGLGTMPSTMREKMQPERGMLLAKIGGPVYRIGVGGGAASSIEVQGSSDSALDFNAVQRGDAEMENKLNRVVRACLEMGDRNPILAIHDQGAGGNGNVLKELVEPGFAGAIIFAKEFELGDPTITALELWGAEYQENNAILCRPEDRALLERICSRERCPISFVGVVTGNGRVTLVDEVLDMQRALGGGGETAAGDGGATAVPFDLELKHVLGEMPKREYHLERMAVPAVPLQFEADFDFAEALRRVLSLVSVGSKRFLTNKVDRCVSGLIVQQQCVGPLHVPLADYGLAAVSHFSYAGVATSIGTQPIKGLLNASAMARMSVAEALTNLVFVGISDLSDVKCSGNWMWPAKLPGEGAKMYEACQEMCAIMKDLQIAVDGGKDSLSMAAKVGDGEVVKSPGTLVVSTYAPCPDVRVKVTPDLKGPALGLHTTLLFVSVEDRYRLGGSALAQAYAQQGNECPNVLAAANLRKAFCSTQTLLKDGKILAGHDVSDGGLLVCLLEMAIGGLAGITVNVTNLIETLPQAADVSLDAAALAIGRPELAILFAEECGWVLEVRSQDVTEVKQHFWQERISCRTVGHPNVYGLEKAKVLVTANGRTLVQNSLLALYKQWEATSYELEKLQANIDCATEEFACLDYRTGPKYSCSVPDLGAELKLKSVAAAGPMKVAVLREEGVNSDREMMACLVRAQFEVHDVTMSDLLSGKTTLEQYRGLVFPGGFSYADTLGSAKGWAANIVFSDLLSPQFEKFRQRADTFSLGICNGCQLMGLIGWVGHASGAQVGESAAPDVALLHNRSKRFECRWSTVRIAENSKAIMLRQLGGSVLGCWVAHGEGRFSFRAPEILNSLKAKNCVVLHYVDDGGVPTETYPMNPNGSVEGIAGLCSEDGRHLALMPHPERCSAMHLWPYTAPGFEVKSEQSPWQLMFHNAYEWCQTGPEM